MSYHRVPSNEEYMHTNFRRKIHMDVPKKNSYPRKIFFVIFMRFIRIAAAKCVCECVCLHVSVIESTSSMYMIHSLPTQTRTHACRYDTHLHRLLNVCGTQSPKKICHRA